MSLSNIWNWIKTNFTGVIIAVLGLAALFFKAKSEKDEAQLETSQTEKIDATLEQKQTDISQQITQVQQEEKAEEAVPHTTEENVDFLKKL